MKQKDVAEKLGISQNYYSDIEKGNRQSDLSLSLTQKLADVFGITLEQIADFENKPFAN